MSDELWNIKSTASPSGAWKIQFHHEKGVRLVGPDGVLPLPPMERPEEGVVFDDGSAVVLDWLHKTGGALGGRICVFRPDGSLVKQHDIPVNIAEPVADPAAGVVYVNFLGSNDPSVEVPYVVAVRVKDGSIAWSQREFFSPRVVPDPRRRAVRLYNGPAPADLKERAQEAPGQRYCALINYQGEFLERYPRNGYEALDWAWSAYEDGRCEDAVERLAEVLEKQVSEWAWSRARRLAGNLAAERGDRELAVSHYLEALTRRPQEGYPWARESKNRGRIAAAAALVEALERNPAPDDVTRKVRILKAEIAEHRGDIATAATIYAETGMTPKLSQLASAAEAQGDAETALRCFSAALSPNPERGLSWAREARGHGKPEIARRWAEEALKHAVPDEVQAKLQRLLGELAEERGDRAAAIAAYREALIRYPGVGVKAKLERLEKRAGPESSG